LVAVNSSFYSPFLTIFSGDDLPLDPASREAISSFEKRHRIYLIFSVIELWAVITGN